MYYMLREVPGGREMSNPEKAHHMGEKETNILQLR